jgi:ABC-type sugar transport system ATPase subunit
MDEPVGTLDADLRLEMRELIKEQQLEMGITTIYVTHDQEEAMSLADKIVVMEGGRMRQSGPPAAVYEDPQDLFVAHFIGSPGMNFIQGEIRQDELACLFTRNNWSIQVERPLAAGPVELGIRPEYVRLGPEGGMPGEVVMDEYLGAWRNIHVETACGRLVLRAKAEAKQAVGARVDLHFDSQHLRFFAAADGQRL